jgi:hypothetical protein
VLFAVGVGLLAASTAYSAYDRYFNQDQSGWQRQILTEGSIQAVGSALVLYGGVRSFLRGRVPVAPGKVGETTSTATGKSIHKAIADARRASGEFDLVQSPITDKAGNPILVSKRVDLKTGRPQPGSPLQEAVPDAVSFKRKLILDDKPLGRPIAKDRQEIIRFIKAYEQREGHLPDVIGITRYDLKTGQQVLSELYSPQDFLP